MNFCTNCGNQLKPEARFCAKCGQAVHRAVMSEKLSQENLCPKCNNKVEPGVMFCVSCGSSLMPLAQAPSVVQETLPPVPVRQDPAFTPTGKRRKVRVFSVLIIMLTLVAVAAAAFYFWRTYIPGKSEKSSQTAATGITENTVIDAKGIEDIAVTTEQVFARSDTAALASIMSSTFLEQRRPYLGQLIPYMPAFAEDFKSRRLLYSNERYAVYEFSSSKGKFTVDFCLGEDGTWKIMRF